MSSKDIAEEAQMEQNEEEIQDVSLEEHNDQEENIIQEDLAPGNEKAEEETEEATVQDVEQEMEGAHDFEEISGSKEGKTKRDLDFLLDIPLEVSVEVGRTKLLINDLLQLGQGSVIELNKLAGEPMEILVNNKLIARGEVVVVNEKFGIRLTDIISPMERVQQLS